MWYVQQPVENRAWKQKRYFSMFMYHLNELYSFKNTFEKDSYYVLIFISKFQPHITFLSNNKNRWSSASSNLGSPSLFSAHCEFIILRLQLCKQRRSYLWELISDAVNTFKKYIHWSYWFLKPRFGRSVSAGPRNTLRTTLKIHTEICRIHRNSLRGAFKKCFLTLQFRTAQDSVVSKNRWRHD